MRRTGSAMVAIRRVLVATTTLLLAAAGLVVGTSGPAYACTCAQVSLETLAKTSDAVFVGTVDSQRTEGGERIYTVRVSDVYSGSPGQTTTVRTSASDAACGMSLRLHRQYMVVGEQPKLHGDVSVTACSGTRPISDRAIATVERALGPATPYRGAPDRNGHQNDGSGGSNGEGESQGESTGDTGDSADDAAKSADASNEAADDDPTSKVVVGVLLALVVGGAFLLPRLRRHNRGGGSADDA